MDYGSRYTEKKISAVDRELKKTYRTAQRELKEKLADFNKRFAEKNREMKERLEAGEITKEEYKDWLTGQVFVRSKWESQIKAINNVLLDHNKQAINLINNSTLDVFAENYNYNAWKAESEIAASFTIYNAQSVARLILGDPQLLPKWKVNEEKDYIWNQEKVNNVVRQAIIQGKGVDEIAKDLCDRLSTMNYNKMRLFARTALGSAQEAGRYKQIEDAAEMGIEVEKKWDATHDNVTRDSHRALDGEKVPYNKPFSNGLMYPKDPTGAPGEVYNCRCTMVTIYPKYEDKSKADWRENDIIDGQSYEEWKKGKIRAGKLAYIATDENGGVQSDIHGAAGSTGDWQKLTKRIEYGELFDEAAVKITKDTLDKLYKEYPLSEPMSIVGDIRIIRDLDRDADDMDLADEYNFGAHYLNRRNTVVYGGGAGIEVLHSTYGTYSLQTEFRERHELRKKYGWANVHTAFDTSSSTLEGTIMHEYAHAIQEEYGLYGGSRSKEAEQFCQWLYKFRDENTERARQISNYAAGHPFEMMAEAFVQIHDTEHTDTEAYKVAKEIWDEFEDYRLGKGRYKK